VELGRDQVAVVTGAGSGIGCALADRVAAEGLRVVLADVDRAALAGAARALAAAGAAVLAVPTDVSDRGQVEALAAYQVSKHGVVTLSETLHHELRLSGAPVGVSVLCPSGVNTAILDSEHTRPPALRAAPPDGAGERREVAAGRAMARELLVAATPPAQIAACVVEAIRAERFYVLPRPEVKERIRSRMDDILEARAPTPTALWHGR
jgi:NAD(P)-dependent dehydrogenase (short-subunit alcohol dehydrogenase family)